MIRPVTTGEPQDPGLRQEVIRTRGRTRAVENRTDDFPFLLWVTVNVIVKVPVLPSVIVTSLIDMVGGGPP